MKKRLILTGLAVLFALGIAFAALEDTKTIPSCSYCGMNREKYAASRMLIEYDDATVVGTCSIHCAAVDMAVNIDKTPKAIKVADYNTKALIDAETAHWVVGGDMAGVMSSRAKWAFASTDDAQKFVAGNKGVAVTFDAAISAAYEDMYTDTKAIRERRKAKKMKSMGGMGMGH